MRVLCAVLTLCLICLIARTVVLVLGADDGDVCFYVCKAAMAATVSQSGVLVVEMMVMVMVMGVVTIVCKQAVMMRACHSTRCYLLSFLCSTGILYVYSSNSRNVAALLRQ